MNNQSIQDFAISQAATLGIRPKLVEQEVWVPHLPGAEGECLGVLDRFNKEKNSDTTLTILNDNRTLISGHGDGYLRCWDLLNGDLKWEGEEKHTAMGRGVFFCLSPDHRFIISGQQGDQDIRIREAGTGKKMFQIKGSSDSKRFVWPKPSSFAFCISYTGQDNLSEIDTQVWQLKTMHSMHYYPQGIDMSYDGNYFATGDNNGLIGIWDTVTKKCLYKHNPIGGVIWCIKWAPDNKRILIGYLENRILIVDAFSGEKLFKQELLSGISALDWSPDGLYFVIGERSEEDDTLRVWDAKNYREIQYPSLKVPAFFLLQWAPNGAFIASGHFDSTIRFWDTRHLLSPQKNIAPAGKKPKTLSSDHQSLLSAYLQLQALGISLPLVILRDLLQLTGGQKINSPLQNLAPNLEPFTTLRWPARARVGLVAWLLHTVPFPGWEPPADCSLSTLEETLHAALSGEPIEPEIPELPLARLQEACKKIDSGLLTLLELLGPDAVAEDPGLPLRLATQIPELPKFNTAQRRLLGLRVSLGGQAGQSTGYDPGADRSLIGGIELGGLRNDWRTLLPSQLALPPAVFQYRQMRSELLYRARQVAEPPRLRPTILVLDTSPAAFGPVEKVTRMAAYTVARTLYEAGLPAILVTPATRFGGKPQILELRHPADWVEIFTRRSLYPMDAAAGLQVAAALRISLAGEGAAEPIVLLLTHPWFGAEETLKGFPGLRGLFVQYPRQQMHPTFGAQCEKWESVLPDQGAGLEQVLGRLIA